jgi:hypothetical protein
MPWLAAGIAAFQLGYSIYEKEKASNELDELNAKGRPNFQVSPELRSAYNQAQDLAKYGTPVQDAAEQQQLVRSQNTGYQKVVDSSPNLAQQALAGINYTNVNAQNQIAARKEDRHFSNIRYAHSLAQAIQGIKNAGTQADISDYNAQQQAYGGAIAQQNENIWSSANQLGYYAGRGMQNNNNIDTTGYRTAEAGDPVYDNMLNNAPGYNLPKSDTNFNPDDPYGIYRARKYRLEY